jgi:radical SAM protein with 4Fe4S-binding SPASM domain
MLTFLAKSATAQFIRSNYFSGGPAYVDIELTNRCNLRCRACWFHGETGVGDRYRTSEMTTGEVLGFIDQVERYGPSIYFGGAEPLIRGDFLTIVGHAKRCDLPVAFTTNGTLLEGEISDKIVELGVDEISLSLDGTEEMHDELRGRGTFGRTMRNLERLLETRRTRKATKPFVTINITVNPLVVGHLKQAIRTIRDATGDEVDLLRIHHLWFVGATELRAHQEAVRKALGRSAAGAASHRLSFSQSLDSLGLAGEISRLDGLEKVQFFPALRGEEVRKFYSEDYRSKKRCAAPFQAVVLKPNGDLVSCPDEWIDDYVLGNIREDPFDTIWSGEKARRFRSVLFRKGSFPACQRCTWMHSL